MANFEIIMPKLGESIEEATITNWFVKEGDKVEEDDVLLEIATDKVDSEIPSPVDGFVKKVLFKKDEVVPVGTVIAIIDLDGDSSQEESEAPQEKPEVAADVSETNEESKTPTLVSSGDRFYSPLVRKIASEEGISQEELDAITGSGLNGRVQKDDVMRYLDSRDPGKPAEIKAETVSSAFGSTRYGATLPETELIIDGSFICEPLASYHVISSRYPFISEGFPASLT
jgi:2-oxoglutarate dehydrogenase E2 component (dihydrolipoamide succinyltransferase)